MERKNQKLNSILRKLSDKNNKNELKTDASWKKRIKKPDIEKQQSDLHETEPFVDIKISEDKEIEPLSKVDDIEKETQAFVDVQIDNSQLSGRICKKCGFHVKEENLNFCPKCGKQLKNFLFGLRR